jgi:hypothetical protein
VEVKLEVRVQDYGIVSPKGINFILIIPIASHIGEDITNPILSTH